MKSFSFILLLFLCIESGAQIKADAILAGKLQVKTKFNDIKQTVNDHYYSMLNDLRATDSVQRKEIFRQLKIWNREFWISENYIDAQGEIINANQLNYQAFQQQQTYRNPVIETQPNQWLLHGPYNSDNGMGRFDKIAFHPTDANTIYAGSPHGGLFRTTNGGNNWFPISSFLPSLGVAGIAIHPVNPNIIYVLSGDPHSGDGSFVNSFFYRSGSLGVFKTTDGGINWQQTGLLAPLTPGYRGRNLIIDPFNPQILIASTSVGIYRTTNGGDSWTLSNGPGVINIWDLKFNSANPGIVYASGNNSFWRSIDNGINFTQLAIPGLGGANRTSIGVTVDNANRVYLLAGPGSLAGNMFQGFFTSTDAGVSFTLVTQTPDVFSNTIGTGGFDQSAYDQCIAVSPVNENQVLVGGLCVWSTTNAGVNWNQVSAYWADDDPYMHPDIQGLAYHPITGDLYCVNDGGIYLFAVTHWARLFNGATTSQFYHFERENDEGDVWGGTQDNGIQEQDVGGNYYMYVGGDGYDVMTDHDYLVADGESDDIYFSLNQFIRKDVTGGITDITPAGSQGFFANLAMSPDLEDKIFAGYSNATYISFDAGDNWNVLGTVPGNWCISTCPSNTNVLYVAGSNHISICNAGTWSNLTASLVAAGYNNALKITDIDVHPANHNIVYISVSGTLGNCKVFRTLNAGLSWENLSFDLPNVPVFSIKRDASEGLYAGTSIGVFYKRNNVGYWEPFSNGLPPMPVTEIELWSPDNQVWISTFGRGIWYTTAYGNCATNLTLNVPVAGNFYSEASNQITSSQRVEGGDGTFVKYNAGNRVHLVEGFKVILGSKFKTFNTGCGGPVDHQKNTGANTTPGTDLKEPIKD